ncbi:hypothetical protein HYH02_002548 [Chlamydomonas schloesseri]|uniref:Uncharacterized protein n=1 Tax=Chlamydomonas schloesseri TaxID=2026947 RepID=A0A835WVH2_9CHLO|nr:hypothetical protein HYH02_002548 [Chlamydomonas schloesseri]|eukprot:KAG2453225.1 hypothetical protein HYH02_002548 [Chlamydomonas schloesseri]
MPASAFPWEGKVARADSLPLLAWQQRSAERLGGASLKRRQVNIFWWNGSVTTAEADRALAAEAEMAQTRVGKAAGLVTGLAAAGQPSTAWPGYGTWRAATIRGFDTRTGRFEVKYHDEPKRSTAHILLPFAVLHFARNPPADGESVRCSPEQQPPPAAAAAATAATALYAGGIAADGGKGNGGAAATHLHSDDMEEDGVEAADDGAVEAPHRVVTKAPRANMGAWGEGAPASEGGGGGGGRALKRRAQQPPPPPAGAAPSPPPPPASLFVSSGSAPAVSAPAGGAASSLAFTFASAAARLRCRSSSTCLPVLESATTTSGGAASDPAGLCEPPAGLLPPHAPAHTRPYRPTPSQSPSPLPPPSPSSLMHLLPAGQVSSGGAAAAAAAALDAAACPYIQEDAMDSLMMFGFEDEAAPPQQQYDQQQQLLQSQARSGGSVSSLCSLTAAGLRSLRVSSVCSGGIGAGGWQQTAHSQAHQVQAAALPQLPQLPLLPSLQQQAHQHQINFATTGTGAAAAGGTSCNSSSSGYMGSSSALCSGGGGGTGARAGQALGPLLSFCAAASRVAAAPLATTAADASFGRPVSAPCAVPMFPPSVMLAASLGATAAPAPIAATAVPAAAAALATPLSAPGGSIAAAALGGGGAGGGRSASERLSLTRIVPSSATSGGASYTAAVAAGLPTPASGAVARGDWHQQQHQHHWQQQQQQQQQEHRLKLQLQLQQQQHQMQVAARMQAQVAALLQPSTKVEPSFGAAATADTAAGPFTRTSQPPSPALPGFMTGHLATDATAATTISAGSAATDATSLAAAVAAAAAGGGAATSTAAAGSGSSGMFTAAAASSCWGGLGGGAPAAGAGSSGYCSLVSARRGPSPLETPGSSPPHPAATTAQQAGAAGGAAGSWAGAKTDDLLQLLPSLGTAATFQRLSQPLQPRAAAPMLQLQPAVHASQQAVAGLTDEQRAVQVHMQMRMQPQPSQPLQPLPQSHLLHHQQVAAAAAEGCSSGMPTVPIREELATSCGAGPATAAGSYAAGPAGVAALAATAASAGYCLGSAWRQTSEAAALAALMEEWSQQPVMEGEGEETGQRAGAGGEPSCGERRRLTQVLLSHGFGGGPSDMMLM